MLLLLPKHLEFSQIPNHGVGLAREEFIINNYIKVHPFCKKTRIAAAFQKMLLSDFLIKLRMKIQEMK